VRRRRAFRGSGCKFHHREALVTFANADQTQLEQRIPHPRIRGAKLDHGARTIERSFASGIAPS
jgi:hypothetical protein